MKPLAFAACFALLSACSASDTETAAALPDAPQPGTASTFTVSANQELADRLPLDDPQDFDDSERGFIAAIQDDAITDENGSVVWQISQYDFVEGDAPNTVNPSLWRQAKLVSKHGLFEVTEGVWQVRGYDLSVMSIIEGKTGWIVVDPLTNMETAAASLKLVNDTLGERPVTGMIYTHSHADHFGGARGIITEDDIAARNIPVLAPHGFSEEAVSENVLAGNHMARRATLMFGATLPRSPAGHVSSGLGPGLPRGTVSLVLPTEELPKAGGTRTIDGVVFEFMDAGGTEAPSEFMFYLPELRALCTAEVATGTFHNVLTPRGSKSRDALGWSEVIDDVLQRYGDQSDVVFASHHWPRWGTDNVKSFLKSQRDIYRYVHDTTLSAANKGAGMAEAAESVEEPEFLNTAFNARGYYGTLNHNSKAVYQHYYGWWSGVPADYYRHPPTARAERLVAELGGPDAALQKGINAYEDGDYRWAAELINYVVFADRENQNARDWLAATYEQIAYQAESGAWRSYFLAGAQELRQGVPTAGGVNPGSPDVVRAVPTRLLLNAMATRYTPANMPLDPFALGFDFTDTEEAFTINVSKSIAQVSAGLDDDAAATITLTRTAFNKLITQEETFRQLAAKGDVSIDGEATAAGAFLLSLETPEFWFPVATP